MALRTAKRLLRLSRSELELVAKTSLLTTGMQAALALVSFKTLLAALEGRPSPAPPAMPNHSAETIAWAVAAVGRRIPGSSCLVQALTAHALLRSAGFDPQLRIGIRNESSFEAHAWVLVDDHVVVGASDKAFVDFPLRPGAA